MARAGAKTAQKPQRSDSQRNETFRLRGGQKPGPEEESQIHVLREGILCDTERRGHATPGGRSPSAIVVDASEGFIPLWAKGTTLRWRFRERSLDYFANPKAAKAEIRDLFSEALLKWGTAAPVTFKEEADLWDFELVVRNADNCRPSGCVLASAFFPDSGRHQLVVYPKMFEQSRKEQVDTFTHEIGHVFGLRHFFAEVSESAWPSEIFGTHSKFSIMNYGELSELTTADKDDLMRLYQLAWSGMLTHVNGTPIQFVKAYHTFAPSWECVVPANPIASPFLPRLNAPDSPLALSQIPAAFQLQSRVANFGGIGSQDGHPSHT